MKIWVYLDGQQQGPFELEQLYDLPITRDTKVWFEGLPRWCAAGELEPLNCLFSGEGATSDSAQQAEQPTEQAESADAVETVVLETIAEAPVNPLSPGQAPRKAQPLQEPCPDTYIGWSIALAICCCSPVSIGAVVASICVTTFYNSGKLDKARKASEWAAWLVMIAIALGFLPVMLMSAIFGK